MKILKQLVCIAPLAAAVLIGAVAGCGTGGGGPPGVVAGTGGAGPGSSVGGAGGAGGAGGGPGKVPLVDWVTDLAVSYAPDTTPPDTVEDKVDIVIDTSDPAAFDPLLQQQP
ncbi:MAG TPA: hypothetical protein VFH68_26345 [Polyangia bacterium]|nr:hypothetical protein [Polyangia bacterium]